jgi:hypothetical protein
MIGKPFAEIKVVYVENLPLKKVDTMEQGSIISIVDEILGIKKGNPQVDTSALENKIDLLVYKLFNLSKEEIKIVEGTFNNSKVADD